MENKNPYRRFQINAEIQSTKITSEIMIKDINGKKRGNTRLIEPVPSTE